MQAWRKYVTAPAANVFAYLAPADQDGPVADVPVPPPAAAAPAPVDGYTQPDDDVAEEALSETENPQSAAPGYGGAPMDGAPKKRKAKKKKNPNRAKEDPAAVNGYLPVEVQSHSPVENGLNGHGKLAASAYFTEDAAPVVISGLIPMKPSTNPTAVPAMPDFSSKLRDTSSPFSREGFNANWNERFQALVEGAEQDEQAKLKKYEKLSALWREFLHTAKSCGKIIISERQVSNERRTIPSVALGGCAGGVKYIYHGILFKFAIDDHHLYGGSDHFAQKAAGHELKGLMRYFMQPGLHVPLMALIDYKGHRLVASSILPIKAGEQGTIRYGSPDGGKHVYDADAELRKLMEQAGKRLNLKGHMAGQTKGDRKFLFSPCDIEGHQGTDGRFYVIDLARVFPPAAEEGVRKTYLYRLLRPEFVKTYHKALSSDAFSLFGGPDNNANAEGHDREVQEATNHLLELKIPGFAAWLDEQVFKNGDDFQITELIHREGINVRYLGRVRALLRNAKWRGRLLLEMVARVMKNDIRQRMRDLGASLRENPFAETKFTKTLLKRLNLPLQSDENSRHWWEDLRHQLVDTFHSALTPEELNPKFDLKASIAFENLFHRLQHLIGVRFSKQCLRELSMSSTTFRLVAPDLKKLSARVKGLNVLALAEGNWLAIQSRKDVSQFGSDRLFRLAIKKFEAAIRSTPDNLDVLNQFAHSLVSHALKGSTPDSVPYLTLALERFAMAGNFQRLLELGRELQKVQKSWWNDRDAVLALAIRCYQVVSQAPNLAPRLAAESCENWGALLVKQARRFVDDKRYAEAGEKYRQMLNFSPQHRSLGRWALELDNVRLAAVVELLRERSVVQTIDTAHVYKRSLVTQELLLSIAANCRQMTAVALGQCSMLPGETLAKLTDYCALTRLDVTDCQQLKDADIVAAVRPSLVSVVLTGCVLLTSASVQSLVEQATGLEELSVRRCPLIDDTMPPMMRFATKLTSLDMTRCSGLTFASMHNVGEYVPRVEVLRLGDVKGAAEGTLKSIGENCPRLRVLILRNFPVSLNFVLHYVTDGCPQLETVDVGEVVDTRDPLLERMIRLPKLTELSVHACEKLTDQGMRALLRSSQLRYLDFSHCYRISSDTAGALLRTHSSMQTLLMNNCANVDDVSLANLGRCTSLQLLSLAGCTRLSDPGATSIAQYGQMLRSLDISESEVTDDGIGRIADRCTHLTSLQLSKCKFLTDIGLRRIAASCHLLRLLELRECLCVSSVAVIPTGCPNLDVLDLYGDENVSDVTVQLLDSLALLKWLNLQRVKKLTDASLLRIGRGCPSLRVLVLGFNKVTDDTVENFQLSRPGVQLHLDGYKNKNHKHEEADL